MVARRPWFDDDDNPTTGNSSGVVMRVAITGGTGFVGRHLASRLQDAGHEVQALDRHDDVSAAFAGCDAVVHCAGINREIGSQTYRAVHVDYTRRVVQAARGAGVRRIAMLSFLRARPDCGSGYHESKWAAEEIVRNSGLDYTVLKAGVVYGRGDHLLDHLARSIMTIRLFAVVGAQDALVRPVAVEDVVRIFDAALAGRLSRRTLAVIGPELLPFSGVVGRVAQAV